MKTIAFFVRNIAADLYPFSVRDLYYYSYQEYLLAMKDAGADVYFVTGNDSYLGNGRFSQAYSIDQVCEVSDFTPVGEIQADIVYDKGGFEGQDVIVVTDHRLRPVISDKAETYRVFGKFQPLTIVCNSREALQEVFNRMGDGMIVVKNPVSSGGKQVYMGTKNTIQIPEHETFPLIVQEFIDMSDGIPGLAKGVHDVRVLIAGGDVIGATLREPADGSLYANVSKGGSERLLTVGQIPAELIPIAKEIDTVLGDYPRYYAADFALGKNGWKLVELNYKPGLFRMNTDANAPEIIHRFAKYMAQL